MIDTSDNQELKPASSLFPEWMETHKQAMADYRVTPRQIVSMWRRYGKDDLHTCGSCNHCVALDYHNKTYFKCDLYAITHGAGSDWRKKWIACGKFEAQP